MFGVLNLWSSGPVLKWTSAAGSYVTITGFYSFLCLWWAALFFVFLLQNKLFYVGTSRCSWVQWWITELFKGAVCSISPLHQTAEALSSRLISEQIIHPHSHQTDNSDQSITLHSLVCFLMYIFLTLCSCTCCMSLLWDKYLYLNLNLSLKEQSVVSLKKMLLRREEGSSLADFFFCLNKLK